MLSWVLALFISIFSFAAHSSQDRVKFPNVEKNVPYAKVASLAFSAADEKISYGENAEQYALLWRAKQTQNTQQSPLVILIHGGCWLSAYDIQHTYALSTGLAQAGFNVWSLEYRRSGVTGGGWPITFDDVKAGILAASRYNNGEYKLANSVLVGHSAGGHLALLAGAEISQLKGVIGLAAITNIEAYAKGENSCQTVTKDFMQGMPADKPSEYIKANPSKQTLHTNSVLLQGSADPIVPAFELEKLNRTIVLLEGVGHFDWIHPGSMAFSTLIKNLHGID
ncbi:MAG: acetyl esterase/lipase [Colwellia polaris]|jgi:acetyl esterase/lipase